MTRERKVHWLVGSTLVWLAAIVVPLAQVARPAPSGSEGVDSARLGKIDDVVAAAIADHKLPGAVVLVGRGDAVVFRKAYGN